MANLKASIKDIKKSAKKRAQNLSYKSKMKKAIRAVEDAVEKGMDKKGLLELVSKAYQIIDKSCKVGVVHRNNAARKKSKLAKAVK
ncbi:MAG TPA: 30S ribosomal protein S20 [Patescibacteria group bacterium]|nr:30S ribosomal protein S20 [Patescibacteria group bacterium]